ncbi:butyrate kinase [bacterium]|nr:butyrate kinase [bacterium]
MSYIIVVINPGATSTKVAYFEDENQVFAENIKHHDEDLSKFERDIDQFEFRINLVKQILEKNGVNLGDLSAVVGRGGPFKPLVSGTYRVNEAMLDDVREGRVQATHISNIGCLLANALARPLGIPAFIVDPVSVDEFEPLAYYSGLPELPRVSLAHALNIKMVAKKYAKEAGKPYENMNLVIAHLGSGISITAHKKGRMVDVNNANDGGPFSPQRTGTLPVTGLMKLCYSGKYSASEMKMKLIKKGGLLAYLETDDMVKIENNIKEGDRKSRECIEAMAYQIGKEIAAMAAVLKGEVDAILITGGLAQSEYLMGLIEPYIKFIAPVKIFPGEDEMEALARGVIRVLGGEEKEQVYS